MSLPMNKSAVFSAFLRGDFLVTKVLRNSSLLIYKKYLAQLFMVLRVIARAT